MTRSSGLIQVHFSAVCNTHPPPATVSLLPPPLFSTDSTSRIEDMKLLPVKVFIYGVTVVSAVIIGCYKMLFQAKVYSFLS
ncbi:hypothetical protein QVD17_26921 [Tagetes erecta]|uniref:Uncharacterized protein n=1 Tax=Tagetes erecta TaxID=13708 RepID=A0AAD8K7T5_TARER|nr:hypothetical protein QVD17_26921 [Tagetes erecta]